MSITLISVQQARALQAQGMTLFDIREPGEWAASGVPQGARTVAKSELERTACHHLSGPEQPFMLSCGGGKRAPACAEQLAAQGYQAIFVVEEGMRGWLASGLPLQSYAADDFELRYARQIQLPQIGSAGQRRLAEARVLLVGAGGLGSPCAYYLAAAGVGHLRILDDDVVEVSNLQRQILHNQSRIAENKAFSAKMTLEGLNPLVTVEAIAERLSANNINHFNNVDLVIDGTDNFATRYLISDTCNERGLAWLYGAVHRFDGQLSLFHASRPDARPGCYRCLFPEPMLEAAAPNCVEAGVLGVTPGVIGLLMASEALKFLLGIGNGIQGRLLSVDLLSMHFHETQLKADPDCKACGRVGAL